MSGANPERLFFPFDIWSLSLKIKSARSFLALVFYSDKFQSAGSLFLFFEIRRRNVCFDFVSFRNLSLDSQVIKGVVMVKLKFGDTFNNIY